MRPRRYRSSAVGSSISFQPLPSTSRSLWAISPSGASSSTSKLVMVNRFMTQPPSASRSQRLLPCTRRGWAVEMNGKTPRHLAGGVAQVDRVAVTQVCGHRVVPAADTDQNPIQDAGLIECSKRQRCRFLAAWKEPPSAAGRPWRVRNYPSAPSESGTLSAYPVLPRFSPMACSARNTSVTMRARSALSPPRRKAPPRRACIRFRTALRLRASPRPIHPRPVPAGSGAPLPRNTALHPRR